MNKAKGNLIANFATVPNDDPNADQHVLHLNVLPCLALFPEGSANTWLHCNIDLCVHGEVGGYFRRTTGTSFSRVVQASDSRCRFRAARGSTPEPPKFPTKGIDLPLRVVYFEFYIIIMVLHLAYVQ
ncbi:hypothetical protein PTT47_10990 [Serratia ureilytica]|uniref:hypothetical protein n=1 Tax=Serratia ureilytica TaxID=300181 RepID=UPI00313DD883